jgi:hypothetical protein
MATEQYSKTVWKLTHIIGRTNAEILGVVWSFCQMGKGYCFASIWTIGDSINISEKTTWKALKWLERHGYIAREKRDSHETDNIYCTTRTAQWYADNSNDKSATSK